MSAFDEAAGSSGGGSSLSAPLMGGGGGGGSGGSSGSGSAAHDREYDELLHLVQVRLSRVVTSSSSSHCFSFAPAAASSSPSRCFFRAPAAAGAVALLAAMRRASNIKVRTCVRACVRACVRVRRRGHQRFRFASRSVLEATEEYKRERTPFLKKRLDAQAGRASSSSLSSRARPPVELAAFRRGQAA